MLALGNAWIAAQSDSAKVRQTNQAGDTSKKSLATPRKLSGIGAN